MPCADATVLLQDCEMILELSSMLFVGRGVGYKDVHWIMCVRFTGRSYHGSSASPPAQRPGDKRRAKPVRFIALLGRAFHVSVVASARSL
jgi:hypothetical protein